MKESKGYISLVFYDISSGTKENKKKYRTLTKLLKNMGYYKLQASVYARKVNYKDSLKQHKDNLKAISPNNSNIRMLILTKNQFRELVEITGAETLAERILKNDNIILKF